MFIYGTESTQGGYSRCRTRHPVLPISKAMPKEMLPIVDKPAIQYIVEEAVASGIEDILIITNRGKGIIEDHFDHMVELEQRAGRQAVGRKRWIS